MNFITREQYLVCLSCATLYECVQMFWKVLAELNPDWESQPTIVVSKREWDKLFASINGLPFSRSIPTKVSGDEEVHIRIRGIKGRPEHQWHPLELFVYPLAVPLWEGKYKSHYRNKRVIKKYLIHLDEIRALIKRRADYLKCGENWVTKFDHTDPSYHDLDCLVNEARNRLEKLETFRIRASLRK